jgi:hypothetical protein
MFDYIASQSFFEDNVLGDGYAFINGQPVALCNDDKHESVRWNEVTYNNQHEVLKNLLEARVSGDGNCAIDECPNEGPNEPGNPLCMMGQNLEGERQRVDIRTVVANDAESEDNDKELAKTTPRWK